MTETVFGAEPIVRLHFVKFRIVTYMPITSKSIEEHGRAIWFFERHPFTSELLQLLGSESTSRQIDLNAIRMKVEFGAQASFLVDRNGIVLRQETRSTYVISGEKMEEIEKQIAEFYGVVDVKAYRER